MVEPSGERVSQRKGTGPLLVSTCLAALVLAACSVAPRHSGKEPWGERTPYPDAIERKQARAAAALEVKGDTEVDESERVEGVFSTKLYHTSECERLQGVPTADRVPFVSGFDGLDAGYAPCQVCHTE